MSDIIKMPFNLVEIAEAFQLEEKTDCQHLTDWLSASYTFNETENIVLNDIFSDTSSNMDGMNEEELKIRVVAPLFYIAKIDEPKKIRVFYERPLSVVVNNYMLSVVCDCMVATPRFNAPIHPHFFLQEFKKAKGEKKDPEAQMLVAMLAAQHINNDNKPLYGGFLIGSTWRFATLIGREYCASQQYLTTRKEDLHKIASIIRKLKQLVIER
jgi:hypothetical protein